MTVPTVVAGQVKHARTTTVEQPCGAWDWGCHAAAPIDCIRTAWRHVDAEVDGQLAMHNPLPVTRQANVTRPTNDTQ